MEQDDEIAALKSQVAALEARLDERDAKDSRKSIVRPPIGPIVRVTYPVAASPFVMPSDDELEQLVEVVTRKYPALGDTTGIVDYGRYRPDPEECAEREGLEYSSQFKTAFRALGNLHRTETPDRKRYVTHWVDLCEFKSPGATLRFSPPLFARPWRMATFASAGCSWTAPCWN
jgi:hypothetical protein